MTDHFATTVHNLVNATRTVEATPPEPSDARHIRRLADFVACQHNNPFVDFALPHLLAIDFAEATLAWLDDPASESKVAGLRNSRTALLNSLTDE